MDTPTVTIPHSPSPSTGSNRSDPPSPILAPSIAPILAPPVAPIIEQPQTKEVQVENQEDPEVLVQRYMDSVRNTLFIIML